MALKEFLITGLHLILVIENHLSINGFNFSQIPENIRKPYGFLIFSMGRKGAFSFFFYQGLLQRQWGFTEQLGKGGDHLLFHTNTSTCVYQTSTRWDLPPYRITIWVIDWWCNVCLFTWWIDTRFLLQQFGIGNWWIWTRIDYHPCITSKPTNQVCIGNIRVKSEVPQGFFAVHLLFYIYINDLHCTMKYCIL